MSANSGATSIELLQAWTEYHATLEQMRLLMEATPRFQNTPQHRAKAYHTLMEMQAMAYNFAVAPRLLHPRIYVNCGWQTDMYTLGFNGPDFLYGVAFVDGRQTYRMTGRMGDVTLFLLQALGALLGEPTSQSRGNYDWSDFTIEADGRFEVILSPDRHPGNWIELDPKAGYQFMLIRRAFPNWHGDRGELALERISALADDYYDADEFSESAMATRIRRAAAFVRYLTQDFNIGMYDKYYEGAGRQKNKMSLIAGTITSQVGSPSSRYAFAVFELADDEALLLEMDSKPDGVYWSFQLGDAWGRSLDYTNSICSLNNLDIVIDTDGRVRVVVSQKDPGIANWLDTCRHVEGTIAFRNYSAQTSAVPSSRKVRLADLATVLPADTRRVTPDERRQITAHRRLGQRKMFGE